MSHFWFYCSALVCLGSLLASGQAPNYEGRRIASISYVPAEQPLDPYDLARSQPVKPGDAYSSEAIATAIDRLFATGQFVDIQVEAEPSADGVALRFVTTPQVFIGHIGIDGKMALPPNRGQVSSATQLNLGAPFEPAQLDAARANLQRLFESNGLYGVRIDPKSDNDPKFQQVNFTFAIKPGKRAKYITPVIQGDARLSDTAVIRATGWKYRFILGWKKVTETRTRAGAIGVQNRYSKDDRLMAKVELKSLDYDPAKRRVKPTLAVNAGPKVRVKAVEAKVSKRTLKRYVPVYDERRVDNDLLVEGARNLRDYFQTQGYYDVDVDFRQRPLVNDEVVIEYVIGKGDRFKLVDLKVEGNKYFTTDVIRERMFLEPSGFLRYRHGRYSEAFRKKDEENVANLYRANGFRDVKVTSEADRNHAGKTGEIGVILRIEEGPQWFVDDVTLKGNSKIATAEIVARLSSIAGQPYSTVNVAADRAVTLTTYYGRGFPNATLVASSIPGSQPNHVSLVYTIVEGEQQYVRDVVIAGIKHTRMALVNKRLAIEKGEPLSLTAITNGQKNLYDTGVLAKVNTAVQNPEGDLTHKYVLYDIEEAARYNVNVGFGAEFARFGGTANSLDSPAGATGFSPRISLDISRLNMFGTGHFATLRGRFSTLQKRASIEYVAPRFQDVDGRNITTTLLYDDSRDVRTFQAKREEASVQMSQKFSKPTTGLFRYTFRRVETSNVVIPALLVPQLLQPIRIGILSANIVQDRRDNPADTSRGIFNTVDFGLASRYFGSSRTFLRALGRNATYYRLTRNVVLARQTTVGVIFPFSVPAGQDRNDYIPLPERFFGGGSVSNRAFPENQAGPRDIGVPAGPGARATEPTGFPLGGNALLFNTVELRFPLIGDNIRGVVFHDAGNIYRSIGDVSFRFSQRDNKDFNYMVHALGFGIRYKTPIGPVRGDLAYSINPPRFVGFQGTTADLLQCDPSKDLAGLPDVCKGVPQRVSHFQFFFSIGQTF